MNWFELALIGVTTVSLGLYVWQVLLVRHAMIRARQPVAPPEAIRQPRVSILKPLAGLDDELRENLESFAGQQGVDVEILFGVASADDPALPVAADFVAAHPEIDARIYVTDPDAGLNPKVAQLIGLEAQATGQVIVVSDSNVRVGPHYAHNLLTELLRPGVAAVSNVIAGTGERRLGSTLENLMVATFQAPGVVGGWELSGGGKLAITIGKSMAMWRDVLRRAGGFHSVRNVLAEDQALGRRFQGLGYRLGLSFDVIEDRNVTGSLARTLHRHARWAKTRRSIMPLPFVAELVLVPLVFAGVAFALAPSFVTATVMVGVAACHVVGAQVFVYQLRGEHMPWRVAPLEVVRVAVYFGCWVAAWMGNRVRWRGHRLQIGRGAELIATTEAARSALRLIERRERVGVVEITEDWRRRASAPAAT